MKLVSKINRVVLSSLASLLILACGGGKTASLLKPLPLGDGRSVPGVELRLYIQPVNNFEVTDLQSVYVESTGKTGLGFFITVQDGSKYLVYQDVSDTDNTSPEILGSDLGNVLKKVAAAMKQAAGTIDIVRSTPVKGFAKSLEELGKAHSRLSPAQQTQIAEDMKAAELAAGQVASDILLVEEADLLVVTSDFTMDCGNVADVGPVTMTTGGSVYIYHIEMKSGDHLNVASGTSLATSQALLDVSRENVINACLGKTNVTLAIGWNIFQDAIYTQAGTYSGYITNPENLVVRQPEGGGEDGDDDDDDIINPI